MIGAIANDSGEAEAVTNDGSPVPHQYELLPDYQSDPLTVDSPGYLYVFANDAWAFYGNNRGGIQLTVKRVA